MVYLLKESVFQSPQANTKCHVFFTSNNYVGFQSFLLSFESETNQTDREGAREGETDKQL